MSTLNFVYPKPDVTLAPQTSNGVSNFHLEGVPFPVVKKSFTLNIAESADSENPSKIMCIGNRIGDMVTLTLCVNYNSPTALLANTKILTTGINSLPVEFRPASLWGVQPIFVQNDHESVTTGMAVAIVDPLSKGMRFGKADGSNWNSFTELQSIISISYSVSFLPFFNVAPPSLYEGINPE